MSWLEDELPAQARPIVVTPTEPRPTCCTIPTCHVCGGHDPLSGHGDICRCGTGW